MSIADRINELENNIKGLKEYITTLKSDINDLAFTAQRLGRLVLALTEAAKDSGAISEDSLLRTYTKIDDDAEKDRIQKLLNAQLIEAAPESDSESLVVIEQKGDSPLASKYAVVAVGLSPDNHQPLIGKVVGDSVDYLGANCEILEIYKQKA